MIEYIINKSSIITSNVGGGSTSLALYIINNLIQNNNILYYDTTYSINRDFLRQYYSNVFDNCIFFQGQQDTFLNFISELGGNLQNIDYIVIDTADTFGKQTLSNLNNLTSLYNIKLIVTSQLRVNPNTGKPYSTVEEWNKQLSERIFHNSIWIRAVNEPNTITKRKYIDIYNEFRIGNKYYKRYIFNFDIKRGNIL